MQETMEYKEFQIKIGLILGLLLIVGIAIVNERNQEEEIVFNDSLDLIANPEMWGFDDNISSNFNILEPSQFIAIFSPDYKDVEINGEICQEVTCECAKNTSIPCMSICYHCEEDLI